MASLPRRCTLQLERSPSTLRADQAMVFPKLIHGSQSARPEVAGEWWSSVWQLVTCHKPGL